MNNPSVVAIGVLSGLALWRFSSGDLRLRLLLGSLPRLLLRVLVLLSTFCRSCCRCGDWGSGLLVLLLGGSGLLRLGT